MTLGDLQVNKEGGGREVGAIQLEQSDMTVTCEETRKGQGELPQEVIA